MNIQYIRVGDTHTLSISTIRLHIKRTGDHNSYLCRSICPLNSAIHIPDQLQRLRASGIYFLWHTADIHTHRVSSTPSGKSPLIFTRPVFPVCLFVVCVPSPVLEHVSGLSQGKRVRKKEIKKAVRTGEHPFVQTAFLDTPVVRSDLRKIKKRRTKRNAGLYGYSNSMRFRRVYIWIFPQPSSHKAARFFPIITLLWRRSTAAETPAWTSLLMDTKIHFNIFTSMNIFFLFQWEIIKSKVGLPNGGSSADALEREIALSRKKNHCVTPGEKYCCFA